MDQSLIDTISSMVNDFLSFQQTFNADGIVAFMSSHTDIPVLFVAMYLTLIFYVPNNVMKHREPIPCKLSFTIWNLILATFSIVGAYFTVPHLVSSVWTHGFRYTMCVSTRVRTDYFDGPVGLWVCFFILSKIPELMDTVFLVVQKKDVIFLHWFHHVTVMLYCWHSYTHRIASGIWFATMNYAVHSIMYLYYFLMSIGARSLVKPIAPLITSLQILQMMAGMAVTIATFVWRQDEEGCDVDASNSRMGLAMYASYFILFSMLFKKLYFGKAKTPLEKKIAKAKGAEGMCNVEEVQDGAGQFLSFDEKKKEN